MQRTRDVFLRNRLVRDSTRGWLAGVCAGIADRFDMSPGVVRLLFIVLAIFVAFWPMALIYILLAWFMPRPLLIEEDPWSRRWHRRYEDRPL